MAKDNEESNILFEKGKFLKNILLNLFKPVKTEKFNETINPNLDDCICCGSCVEVCPTNAISVFKFKNLICESCGICHEICPNNAIDKDRFSVDMEKCTKCGYCVMFCTIPILKNEIPAKPAPEITKECNNCKLCISKCKNRAISFTDGKIVIDEKKCILCLECAEFCPLNAIYSPEESIRSKIIKLDLNSCIFCKDCEEACPLKR